MTSPRCSRARIQLSPGLLPRAGGWLFGCALLALLSGGCGGQSLSTDTGNPPVVGKTLHLRATATGVIVSGDPGVATAGARVDVVNTATAQTASTIAAADGSFEVELAGALTDDYQVYVGDGQQSWRTRLTSSGSSAPETGLEDRVFLTDTVEGYTPRVPTQLRLSFKDGQVSFRADCNSFSGAYSLCAGRLCVSQLGGTEIGCDVDRQEQDQWFADFFTSSPELSIAGAALTLRGATATLGLLDREVASPDMPLTGFLWTIDTFFQGGAASSLPTAVSPTIQFSPEGRINVFDTCNGGSASYTRSGQTLTLSGVGFSEASCAGTRATEDRIHEVIAEGELTFEIDEHRLTLMRGSTGLGATTD